MKVKVETNQINCNGCTYYVNGMCRKPKNENCFEIKNGKAIFYIWTEKMILKYKEVKGNCCDCIFFNLKTTKDCQDIFGCDEDTIFIWTSTEDEDNDEFVLELE